MNYYYLTKPNMHILNSNQPPKRGKFLSLDEFNPNNLPTVMKKVWKLIKY